MFNEYVSKYLKMQEHTNIMVNVSLRMSISQVPKDTFCSRWIFSIPIGVRLPLMYAIKSLNKAWRAIYVSNIEQSSRNPKVPSYLYLEKGSSFLLILISIQSRLKELLDFSFKMRPGQNRQPMYLH